MRRLAAFSILLCMGTPTAEAMDVPTSLPATSISGIVAGDLDRSVRPQDDFYAFAVGGWIKRVQSPAYMSGWGTNRELQLGIYEGLDNDIRRIRLSTDTKPDERKLFDIYASYMDVARIDALGLRPVAGFLKQFDAANTPADIVRAIAMLSAQGLDVGIGTWVHPDDEDPSRYLLDVVQADLGLPDRDDYISSEPRFTRIRSAYANHVERVLALSGIRDAAAQAKAVVALETRLATAQWTEVAVRVPGATSHRASREQLEGMFPGLDLALYLDGIGVPAAVSRFNIAEPSYFAAYGSVLSDVPVATWRAYLRLRLLDHLARFLPAPYRDEADDFFSKTLYGATAARPRWLRAMGVLEDSMGDALGQLYVEHHFPPKAKARTRQLLDNVVTAFRQRIAASTWLSRESQQAALDKLGHLVIRMGAPDHIRDYSRLVTRPDDAVGNWMRARALLATFQVEKLGKPVDREEWTMSPQSVNGYYSVSRNQVVLPAALLQPPYFQPDADDAVNYGALGFFIAHELTHAFDRAGSQYDGFGKRVEWMAPSDRTEFERRAHALVAQYGGYEAAPGYRINGELTVGENLADNAGLAIAHDAYKLALRGRPSPTIDGFTGDQRFYLGFARIWASEPMKTQSEVNAALTDTHAPDPIRVMGALVNQDAFYKAFDVTSGDRMFVPPKARVQIW